MAWILFINCRVWDGSGAPAFPADVLVDGERITQLQPIALNLFPTARRLSTPTA